MELDETQLFGSAHCENDACVALLVAVGAISAATAIVSGSIVMVGNIIYWYEKKGLCQHVD